GRCGRRRPGPRGATSGPPRSAGRGPAVWGRPWGRPACPWRIPVRRPGEGMVSTGPTATEPAAAGAASIRLLGLLFDDRVAMALPEQTDHVAGPIHDEREEVGDVAAEDAHVEGRRVGEGGKPAAE